MYSIPTCTIIPKSLKHLHKSCGSNVCEKHRAADQLWSLTDEILDRLEMSRNKLAAVK